MHFILYYCNPRQIAIDGRQQTESLQNEINELSDEGAQLQHDLDKIMQALNDIKSKESSCSTQVNFPPYIYLILRL